MSSNKQRKTRLSVISPRTQCMTCVRHNFCPSEAAAGRNCASRGHRGASYVLDAHAERELRARVRKEIEAYCATFRRVKRHQIGFTIKGNAFYIPESRATRSLLSHGGVKERLGHETWAGWCENCGERFETSNERRRLCDACHDEICERLNWSAAHCDELPGEDQW